MKAEISYTKFCYCFCNYIELIMHIIQPQIEKLQKRKFHIQNFAIVFATILDLLYTSFDHKSKNDENEDSQEVPHINTTKANKCYRNNPYIIYIYIYIYISMY